MLPSSKDVTRNRNLKGTKRIKVSGVTASRNNQSPIPNRCINVSPIVKTGRKCQIIKSKASLKNSSIRKHSHNDYVTLLDIGMMREGAPPASRILPTEELIPNSYHQNFHLARWRTWLRETPQWIIQMGRESLWALRRENGHQTPQKEVHKEHEENNDSNDVFLRYESEKDVGMKEIKEKNELREQDSEMKESLTEWRDWSLQITDSCRLLITGKTNQNTVEVSRDVSYCRRVDANTLLHDDGSVYVLSGMPDHFTNLPYYVRNKFQCGFPDDWKAVKCKWMKYVRQGSPCDFNWTVETEEYIVDEGIIEDSTQQNILCQSETSVVAVPSLRMNDHSPYGVPLNHEKFKHSNSMDVPDDSEHKRECLKQPPSTVIEENAREDWCSTINEVIKHLNIKEMTAVTDLKESNCNSSIDFPDPSSYIMHSHVVKKSSNPSDSVPTKDVTDVNILVNQEIVLERWTPVLVNGCDLIITGCIKSELHAEVRHTTDMVEKRKASDCFQSKDGKTYKLMGTFTDPKNTVPSVIKKNWIKDFLSIGR